MPRLPHTDLEQPPIVVDQRRRRERLGLVHLERHPVHGVVREQAQPLVEPLVIEEPRLADEELIDVAHGSSVR